jgi:RNA polymerase sigma factor (sigma-70 family)
MSQEQMKVSAAPFAPTRQKASSRRSHERLRRLGRSTRAQTRRRIDPQRTFAARDELERALATLSAEQRVMIALFAVEGLTQWEIAKILGVPEGTV